MTDPSLCIETTPPADPGTNSPCGNCAQAVEGWHLGRLLIARGDISAEQLSRALASQKVSGRKLGDELISAGFVKGAQVDFVIRIQERLATVAKLSDLL